MKAEIKNLKKRLPKRGYSPLIRKASGNKVSIDQIQNFMQGKAVNTQDSFIIVRAAKKVIAEMEKSKQQLRREMSLA